MKFYNLDKHRQCPNYTGSKVMSFALLSGKHGERMGDILSISLMIFMMSGKPILYHQKNIGTVVSAGEMATAVFTGQSYVTFMEGSACMRLYVQGNELGFYHRIVNTGALTSDGKPTGEEGRMLPMNPEIRAVVRQITGYITDGLMCCKVHTMKQQGLAAVLQAYYRSADLLPFITPIYDPNARFYSDVMKLASQYLPVQGVALQLNMSYPTFIRYFRKIFKETPQAWLSKNRMKQLRDLLCNMAHTDQEIADELDFTTVQGMRAFYKTRSGLTPKQLREQEQ